MVADGGIGDARDRGARSMTRHDPGRRIPPRAVRPEPRVHLLLARSRPDRPRADRARARLQRHAGNDHAADRDRLVRVAARAPDRDRAARRLRRVLRGRAEDAGSRDLVGGGHRVPRPGRALPLRPLPAASASRRSRSCRWRPSWRCSSGSWCRRRSRCDTSLPPRGPRRSSAGRASCSPEASIPKASCAWRPRSGGRSPPRPLAPGAKIRVTRLDGLVLTVEPLDLEHAQPAAPRRPRREPPDGLHDPSSSASPSSVPAASCSWRTRSGSCPSTNGSSCSGSAACSASRARASSCSSRSSTRASTSTSASSSWRSRGRTRSRRTTRRSRSTSSRSTRSSTRR